MNILQYVCWSVVLVLAVVTLVNVSRDTQLFFTFLKWAAVLHIAFGVIGILQHLPMTFTVWLGGGSIVFYGGACVLFNAATFIVNWEPKEDTGVVIPVNNPRESGFQYEPVLETVTGELVDDDFIPLNERNASRVPRLPAIARTSRKVRWGGNGPLGRVVKMPLSDWKSCENIERGHWHTYIDGKEVCEGE